MRRLDGSSSSMANAQIARTIERRNASECEAIFVMSQSAQRVPLATPPLRVRTEKKIGDDGIRGQRLPQSPVRQEVLSPVRRACFRGLRLRIRPALGARS